jgi:hypothetical protein
MVKVWSWVRVMGRLAMYGITPGPEGGVRCHPAGWPRKRAIAPSPRPNGPSNAVLESMQAFVAALAAVLLVSAGAGAAQRQLRRARRASGAANVCVRSRTDVPRGRRQTADAAPAPERAATRRGARLPVCG